jgi:hypothetical protein
MGSSGVFMVRDSAAQKRIKPHAEYNIKLDKY